MNFKNSCSNKILSLVSTLVLFGQINIASTTFAQDPPAAPPPVPPTEPEPGQKPVTNPDNIIAAPWQVGDPCKDYEKNASPQSQRFEYCAAAEQADKAAKKNAVAWKLYAAVTTVCGAYCVANMLCMNGGSVGTTCTVAASLNLSCTATNIGATVYDFMATKDLQTSATSLIGTLSTVTTLKTAAQGAGLMGTTMAQGQAAGEAMGKAVSNVTGVPGMEGQIGEAGKLASDQGQAQTAMTKQDGFDAFQACIPFVIAGITTSMKKDGEKAEKEKAKENRALAKALKSPTQLVAVNAQAPGGATGAGVTGSQGGTSSGAGADGSGADKVAQICDNAISTNDVLPSVQCALATDKRLSPNIGGKDFQDTFQKVAGTDLGSFLANAQTPGQAIGSGLANSIGAAKASEVAQAISAMTISDSMYAALDDDLSNGSYSGGGGAGRRGGGGGNQQGDFENMMKGLMGQLTGEEAGERKPAAAVSALEFKMSKMRPEEVEGSREISLFDRVAIRYRKTKPRLSDRAWAVPYNRTTHDGP